MSVRRTVAALVGAVLLLAGCAGDPEPRFTPTQSPSPTESETSAEPEAQTPEEFIREWVALDNEMQATGDTSAFREASLGCEPCASYADRVEDIYSSGGFIRSDGRTVLAVEKSDGNNTYELRVRSAATRYREREGGPVESYEGGVTTYRLVLDGRGNSWVVVDEVQLP